MGEDVGWARAVIPADDGSLSWGPVGSGLTDSIEKTLERLFERLVTRNDVQVVYKNKSDEDVWRPVRKEFSNQQTEDVDLAQEVVAASEPEKMAQPIGAPSDHR
jgi:hypothetical protein